MKPQKWQKDHSQVFLGIVLSLGANTQGMPDNTGSSSSRPTSAQFGVAYLSSECFPESRLCIFAEKLILYPLKLLKSKVN